jgi:hypothetical protein
VVLDASVSKGFAVSLESFAVAPGRHDSTPAPSLVVLDASVVTSAVSAVVSEAFLPEP